MIRSSRTAWLAPWLATALFVLGPLPGRLLAQVNQVVFLDPIPADTTVDCFADIPPRRLIRALRTSPDGVENFLVTPRDSFADGSNACAGGTLFRIYEAESEPLPARGIQRIDFGENDGGLTIRADRLPPLRDTVDCRSVTNPTDPDGYARWLSERRIAVAAAATADCAPVTSIDDDAPDTPPALACGGELAVTFDATNECGQLASVTFFYVTVDTTGPVIQGVDTLDYRLDCGNRLPPVPEITLLDCDTTASFQFMTNRVDEADCGRFKYTIFRDWTATDSCGNASSIRQTIVVDDDLPPTFQRPRSLEINCTEDYTDLDVTGRPTAVGDNCAPADELEVTFTDNVISDAGCNDRLFVRRTWRVTDPCGNTRASVQEIQVVDEFAPVFTPPPAELTVSCGDYRNTAITGQPTDLFDDCDASPNTSFEDDITPGDCRGNFTVDRRWSIFDDCGNVNFFDQRLTVIDTTPPFFTVAPQDLIGSCNTNASQRELFGFWIQGFLGARWMDDCVDSSDITVTIVETGTNVFPTLPELNCGPADGNIRRLSVDITLSDPCGNARTQTVQYIQRDVESVNIFNCPESMVVPTEPDRCSARVALAPPVIEDKCVSGRPILLDLRDTVVVTSAATNEAELGSVPVDPIVFNFPLPLDPPVNAESFGQLTITIDNADMEGPEEFFTILGEDGTVLGRTARGTVQCETVISMDSLPVSRFNRYALDGVITITLEPNIPRGQPGTFAVNNLCGTTVARARLLQPTLRLTEIVYEVFVDDVAADDVAAGDSTFVTLDPGLHQVRYRATDCGGNTDDCLFTITVEDRQPPVVACPADVSVDLAEDACTSRLELPLPPEVTDNCEPFELTVRELPTAGDARLFRFREDPNLNTPLAQPIAVTLTDAPAGGLVSVGLEVFFRGRFDNTRAILDLTTADGRVLASSRVGDADCSRDGRLAVDLPADVFGELRAADGSLALLLRPRPVTVPPAQPGDGVVACTDLLPDGTDGQSRAYLRVSYRTLRATYSVAGATVLGPLTTSAEAPTPVVDFAPGASVFTYSVTDAGGNVGSCSFNVEVFDRTAPTAVCRATTVFVDPAGDRPGTLLPTAVDGGSFDNCTLELSSVSPNQFDCAQYGETAAVTLTVTDPSGNTDTCSTIVSVAPQPPAPTGMITDCDGNDLQLTANPPSEEAPGQNLYTYRWFNPAGTLISTEKNPLIRDVDPDDSGTYRLEIRGLTGCTSEAVVTIAIGEPLATPVITAPAGVCTGDEVTLVTNTAFAGGNVRYEWFRGDGTPLGETSTNQITVPLPDGQAEGEFYVVAYVSGCPTARSQSVTVTFVEQPAAEIIRSTREFCELGTLTLQGVPQPGLAYRWTGPGGYTSDNRVAVREDLSPADGGIYTLRTLRDGGCLSEPLSTRVRITAASPTSGLTTNGPVCTNDTLRLTATLNGADRYFFTSPTGNVIETDTAVLGFSPVGFFNAGDWTVSVQFGECPSRPSPPARVELRTSPLATARTIPDPVCDGNDLLLQGSSNVADSRYAWTGPGGFTSDNIAPVIEDVDSTVNGVYELTVTTPLGCTGVDTVTVDLLPGLRVDSFLITEGRCLNGGEAASIVAAVSPPPAPGETYRYEWRGPEGSSTNDTLFVPDLSLASNGRYVLTVTNETGCSSPTFAREVNFDFAPAAPLTPFSQDGDYSLCSSAGILLETNDYGAGVTYLWRLPDGTNVPTDTNRIELDSVAGGNYTVRVVRNGCTSLPSEARSLTVTDFPVLTVGTDGQPCAGQAIEFFATDIAGANYVWSGPNNFSSSRADPVISRADSSVHNGRYSVVASLNGCASDTVFVDVAVRPTPAVPVIQSVPSVCLSDAGAVLRLTVNPNTATPGASYQWSINDGQTPVGAATDSLTLEVTDFGLFAGGGVFDFRVSAQTGGCTSATSTPFRVALNAVGDQVADAGPDDIICPGLYLLQAAPVSDAAGRWSLVGGTDDINIVNPGAPTTAVTGLTEFGGPYRFAWTLTAGSCVDFAADTVTITVTDGEAALAGEDFVACIRQETRLDATAPALEGSSGRWSQSDAQELLNVRIVDPTDPNTRVTGLQPDNRYSFTWTVSSNCGVKSDNVLVSVSDPAPDAGDDRPVCTPGRTAALAAKTPTRGSVGRWRSPNAALTFDEAGEPNTTVRNLADGDNVLIFEMDGGICGARSRDTVVITYRQPAAPRDDEYAVEFQGNLTFDPTENDLDAADGAVVFPDPPASGTLTSGPGRNFTFTAPPNFAGEIAVDYEVVTEGCTTARATVFFRVGAGADCRPPNIFTPNNDGMNDRFVVPCLLEEGQFPDARVTIYNQWGDEVYRSGAPYRNDWDGTFQGNQLPVATYFYIIDFGGARENLSGDVRIER